MLLFDAVAAASAWLAIDYVTAGELLKLPLPFPGKQQTMATAETATMQLFATPTFVPRLWRTP